MILLINIKIQGRFYKAVSSSGAELFQTLTLSLSYAEMFVQLEHFHYSAITVSRSANKFFHTDLATNKMRNLGAKFYI